MSLTDSTSITLSGSPTTQFLERLVNSLAGLTPTVSQVTRVVFVDSNNNERDSTTSLTYSIESGKLKISCNITASANYPLSAVRTYDSNEVMVTETSVSRNITYDYTYTVIIYINLSFQYSSNYIYYSGSLKQILYNVLMGVTPPSRLALAYVGFQIYVYEENMSYIYDVESTRTKLSPTSLKISASLDVLGGTSCLEGFRIRNAEFTDMYSYFLSSCQDITETSSIVYSDVLTVG